VAPIRGTHLRGTHLAPICTHLCCAREQSRGRLVFVRREIDLSGARQPGEGRGLGTRQGLDEARQTSHGCSSRDAHRGDHGGSRTGQSRLCARALGQLRTRLRLAGSVSRLGTPSHGGAGSAASGAGRSPVHRVPASGAIQRPNHCGCSTCLAAPGEHRSRDGSRFPLHQSPAPATGRSRPSAHLPGIQHSLNPDDSDVPAMDRSFTA